MDISRRDWDMLMERVGRLDSRTFQLDSRLKNIENFLKPENLLRRIRQAEADEKTKSENQEQLRQNIANIGVDIGIHHP